MKHKTKNIIALSTIVASTVLTLGAVKVTAENLDQYTVLRLVVVV